ncbi:altronate dehydratase family protein [Candidatus Chlorohelix allophototropha]|uniref:Altronate dehydratase family protein n=2 Tax=Candidatus Chlorohelix allophototropha TaxID=3003348 RepID=A0ABY9B1S6_9CHLR|nr:altronate dehydratase family protein [Chloroflexota bacterium L227-S17]
MDSVRMNSNNINLAINSTPKRGEPVNLREVAVLLHPGDDVAIARMTLLSGALLRLPDDAQDAGKLVEVVQLIQPGHKVALRDIAVGSPVRRYGSVIGFTTQAVQTGQHVHTHNLSVGALNQNYEFGVDYSQVEYVAPELRRTFMGYKRPNGKAATRNYIAIIGTVNCSASAIRLIQNRFGEATLRDFPNVDGVIGLTHKSGCGMRLGSDAVEQLQRTLAGMAVNANVGAYVLVGLGCEINQVRDMIESMGLSGENGNYSSWKKPLFYTIQENHGISGVVAEVSRIVGDLLPEVNAVKREPIPVSEITLALQCGGSDGWSGITANPALGFCVDELVRQGGTAILSETPEIYGAEHMLIRRAKSREVGEALLERFKWWEHYTSINGMEMDNNPTPGNKLGGLTTIYEKSLGAIAKGGSTPLNAVYKYAHPVTERGLVIMDTPGYDPVSATGQVAGGANMIAFTTGRGSVFGFKPAPSIKVSTNSTLYENMPGDIDVDAGVVLDGISTQEVGRRIFEEVIAVASGKQSKSEAQGIGEEEFCPWILGATL